MKRHARSAPAGRATIKAANLKIQALTLELAHHRRIRFGNKSEPSRPEQRELFQETWDTDLGAIEAEVDAQSRRSGEPPKRARTRPPAAARASAARRISSEPDSCTCAACGKPGEDRRGHQRAARCGAGALLRAASHPPAVRLPWVRDGVGGGDPARRDRRGMAAVGLYVWVIMASTWITCRFYQLEQIAARDGVILSRVRRWPNGWGASASPCNRWPIAWRRCCASARCCMRMKPLAQLDPSKGQDATGLSVGLPQ